MYRRFLPLFAAIALTACASTPAYQAAVNPNATGYSERQIETNRYFVTYRASQSADAALLSDYALLRAAELTLEHNHDWFWVDRRTTDNSSAGAYSGPTIGVGVGGGSWGGHGGGSVGVGVNFPLGGHSGESATGATLEIRFGEGAKPDDPNAYDARSISTNVRSRLTAAR